MVGGTAQMETRAVGLQSLCYFYYIQKPLGNIVCILLMKLIVTT